ncbi:hypothetical protein [Cohnella candidum]|uniref:Uncharacterized protein n=1 Tax=Cohnella candidum TaxID=2674991 RepID=A0A3G3JX97_9BACL|nr:hypothetical protein [Cohnella candidum]AYQ72856.1 hypothetical protein EAV92_09945 [Cohnella candidum]
MDLVDVSNVSPALFVTGAVFILLIGSFLSLGVVRFFQLRKGQGSLFLGLSALSLAALIWSVNTWFV